MKQTLQEEPFFFDNSGGRLFGILHHPNNNTTASIQENGGVNNSQGLVLCSPFAEEKLWSHRIFVSFARKLARKGYYAFRFDYMGHGDSEGDFEDSSIETRLSDIGKAVEILKDKANVTQVGLLGLRLGATLTSIFAERDNNIEFLILWEPIIKVETYLQHCLRSNLATQMAAYKKIIKNRKEITEDLLSGNPANIDGYLVSSEFYKQASKINLLDNDINFSNPVLIVHISNKENAPVKKDIQLLHEQKYKNINKANKLSTVIEEPFWTEIKEYYQNAHNLFSGTISWLSDSN